MHGLGRRRAEAVADHWREAGPPIVNNTTANIFVLHLFSTIPSAHTLSGGVPQAGVF